jgi:hypothetical protein
LAIFDKGRALALYHCRRLASPAQRIVLYAKGCSGYALLDRIPGQQIPNPAGGTI